MKDITSKEVKQRLAELKSGKKKLLKSGSTNTKLKKNSAETYIMNLAPAKQNSKQQNNCIGASPGCIKACLFTSGHGRFTPVQRTRMLNTEVYVQYPQEFLLILRNELEALNKKAKKQGNKIAVRVNGTSDRQFYKEIQDATGTDVLSEYTDLILYDYTKRYRTWEMYKNSGYSITFSRSEVNWLQCQWVLEQGGNVAVVFYPKLPDTYMGYPVISGDENDERYLDPKGVIIGLKYKRSVGGDPLSDPFVVKI